MIDKEKPTVVDLFSGAGGLSYGFKKAGYRVLAALDTCKDAKATYEKNFPNAIFYHKAIKKIAPEIIKRDLGLKAGELDCLIGGPPCQGFSVKGDRRMDDPRNILFRRFMIFVKVLKPKIVLIENVPQILTLGDKMFRNEIQKLFGDLGYEICYKNLLASDYGVPQRRRRAFFLASSNHKEPQFPPVTHAPKRKARKLGLLPYVTIKEAIGDFPRLRPGGRSEKYSRTPFSKYQRTMRGEQTTLYNHEARIQNALNMDRIAHLRQGWSMKDLPSRLQAKSGYSQAYGRLSNNKQACTITANMHNLGSGRYIHPTQSRSITAREAARLQSFDDYFIFCGTPYAQCRQIGNAVPPLLAKTIAEQIRKDFFDVKEKCEPCLETAASVV